jgi:hypothetical protein
MVTIRRKGQDAQTMAWDEFRKYGSGTLDE